MKKGISLTLLLCLMFGGALCYLYPVLTFRGIYEGQFSDGSGTITIEIEEKCAVSTRDENGIPDQDESGNPWRTEYEYKLSPFRRLLLVDVGIRKPHSNEIDYYPISLGYGEIDYHEIKGERIWLQKVN